MSAGAPGSPRAKDLPRCSDTARARSDPLTATAPPARRWLLLEHPGPWAPDALGGSGVDRDVVARLARASRSAGGRVLLVRRPGRRTPPPELRWAVADAEAGATTWGRWAGGAGHDLDAAEAVLRDGPGATGPAGSPTGSRLDDAPLLLVCAHGRHDACCAVRGRPVAAALEDRWPGRVWECSHVGGDRFAANLVVLPDGTYYGGLDPANAATVVERHLGGAVDTRHLRGSTSGPPVVQAAVAAALERFGPAAIDDARAAGVEAAGEDRWHVRLLGTGPVPATLLAVVARTRRPPARLTCRASVDASAAVHEVVELVVPG